MTDKTKNSLLIEMMEWVKENKPRYFYEIWHYALDNRDDWAQVLRHKNPNYMMKEYIRSSYRVRRKAEKARHTGAPFVGE